VLILERRCLSLGEHRHLHCCMNAVGSKLHKDRGVKSWTVDEFYEWTMMGGRFIGAAPTRCVSSPGNRGTSLIFWLTWERLFPADPPLTGSYQ